MERKRKFKFRHVMKDGTVRESMEGVVVDAGHPVYGILRQIAAADLRNGKEAGHDQATA